MSIKSMTITSIFIVPTLKIDKNQLKDNNFINAYIKDLTREEQYEDAAYLLFKPKDLELFKDFVDAEYDRTESIIDDYDHDGGLVVLVYTLDPDFKHDFEFVKHGHYSRTSKEFQKLFPKVIKVIKNGMYKDEISLQHRVFNKSEDLKNYWEDRFGQSLSDDMEVWEGFDEKNETLDIDKIKELI